MQHRKLAIGAGITTLAALTAGWTFWPASMTPQQLPRPAAVAPAPASTEQHQAVEPAQPAEAQPPRRSASAAFAARFKAAREVPRPPPNPEILQARTFAEAFQAMKRAEEKPAEAAAANPFAGSR